MKRQVEKIAYCLQNTSVTYFLEVFRCGSITEASHRLNIAGSAISRHISQLENQLGATLFERKGNGMQSTSAGELLASYAHLLTQESGKVVQDIQTLRYSRRGKIRILSAQGFLVDVLPNAVDRFQRLHPDIEFHVMGNTPSEIRRHLLLGDADIAITMSRISEPEIEVKYSQPCPIVAIVARHHPLLDKASVTLDDLCAYPAVLPEKNMSSRQLFDLSCAQEDITPNVIYTSNNINSRLHFIRLNNAFTVCSEISARHDILCHTGFPLRLFNTLPHVRNMEIQIKKGKELSPAAEVFLDSLIHDLQQPVLYDGNAALRAGIEQAEKG